MPVAKKTNAVNTAKDIKDNVVEKTPEVENTSGASTTSEVSGMSGLNMEVLMQTLNGLQNTINNLQTRLDDAEKRNNELEETNKKLNEDVKSAYISTPVSPVVNAYESKVEDKTERLLEYLTNKKSDREVVIVHNRELIPGLTTHIELTGLTIDFRTLGEERVVSWQQFEECVSKYRKWFEEEIILLGNQNAELAENYNIPCVKRKGGMVVTRTDLAKLGDMDVRVLEDFYNSLTEEDKAFVCSYWLGKCYEKDAKYYDRYKVELLNRLSRQQVFDNILAVMNNDFMRKEVDVIDSDRIMNTVK